MNLIKNFDSIVREISSFMLYDATKEKLRGYLDGGANLGLLIKDNYIPIVINMFELMGELLQFIRRVNPLIGIYMPCLFCLVELSFHSLTSYHSHGTVDFLPFSLVIAKYYFTGLADTISIIYLVMWQYSIAVGDNVGHNDQDNTWDYAFYSYMPDYLVYLWININKNISNFASKVSAGSIVKIFSIIACINFLLICALNYSLTILPIFIMLLILNHCVPNNLKETLVETANLLLMLCGVLSATNLSIHSSMYYFFQAYMTFNLKRNWTPANYLSVQQLMAHFFRTVSISIGCITSICLLINSILKFNYESVKMRLATVTNLIFSYVKRLYSNEYKTTSLDHYFLTLFGVIGQTPTSGEVEKFEMPKSDDEKSTLHNLREVTSKPHTYEVQLNHIHFEPKNVSHPIDQESNLPTVLIDSSNGNVLPSQRYHDLVNSVEHITPKSVQNLSKHILNDTSINHGLVLYEAMTDQDRNNSKYSERSDEILKGDMNTIEDFTYIIDQFDTTKPMDTLKDIPNILSYVIACIKSRMTKLHIHKMRTILARFRNWRSEFNKKLNDTSCQSDIQSFFRSHQDDKIQLHNDYCDLYACLLNSLFELNNSEIRQIIAKGLFRKLHQSFNNNADLARMSDQHAHSLAEIFGHYFNIQDSGDAEQTAEFICDIYYRIKWSCGQGLVSILAEYQSVLALIDGESENTKVNLISKQIHDALFNDRNVFLNHLMNIKINPGEEDDDFIKNELDIFEDNIGYVEKDLHLVNLIKAPSHSFNGVNKNKINTIDVHYINRKKLLYGHFTGRISDHISDYSVVIESLIYGSLDRSLNLCEKDFINIFDLYYLTPILDIAKEKYEYSNTVKCAFIVWELIKNDHVNFTSLSEYFRDSFGVTNDLVINNDGYFNIFANYYSENSPDEGLDIKQFLLTAFSQNIEKGKYGYYANKDRGNYYFDPESPAYKLILLILCREGIFTKQSEKPSITSKIFKNIAKNMMEKSYFFFSKFSRIMKDYQLGINQFGHNVYFEIDEKIGVSKIFFEGARPATTATNSLQNTEYEHNYQI